MKYVLVESDESVARVTLARPDEGNGFQSAQQRTKRLFYGLDDLGFREGIDAEVRVELLARTTGGFRESVLRLSQNTC